MSEDTRKRQRYFKVHLLDEELELLNAKADEVGQNKSEYIRNMILFGATKIRPLFSPETEAALRYELNKIGTNLNQIAVRVNSNKTVDDRDFDNLYHNYVDILATYDRLLRGKPHGDY